MRRSRCGGAACGEAAGTQSVPREGWNPVPCVGDGGGLDRGGALERAQQGRSPGARPGPGSGPATPETLNNAQRTAGPVGRAEPEPAERGRASWCEGERSRRRHADDTLQRAKEEGEAHIKPEPQGRAGKGAKRRTRRSRVGWDRRSAAWDRRSAPRRGGALTRQGRHVEVHNRQRLN